MDEDSGFSQRKPAPIASSTIISTGPLRLVALQEPQENFHKDEGGKANQLTFRVILQGELSPEMLGAGSNLLHGTESSLSLSVKPIFDDGEIADSSILDIVGGTEGPHPCIQIRSRLGGVRYRLLTVSKRLSNRGIGVMVEVVGCPSIAPLRSETTMVYSKRKNREQRLEEQARERSELLDRQRAAASLLNTRAITTSNTLPPLLSVTSSSSIPGLIPTPSLTDPSTFVVRLPVPTTTTTVTTGTANSSSSPSIVALATRPRRLTQDSESDDSNQDYNSTAAAAAVVAAQQQEVQQLRLLEEANAKRPSSVTSRKKARSSSTGGGGSSLTNRRVEERLIDLEQAHERLKHEVDYLRGSINLHLLANQRSSSIGNHNNVSWDFSEGTGENHSRSLSQNVAGIVSPPLSQTPSLVDSQIFTHSQPSLLTLRRDISTSSQLPSSVAVTAGIASLIDNGDIVDREESE